MSHSPSDEQRPDLTAATLSRQGAAPPTAEQPTLAGTAASNTDSPPAGVSIPGYQVLAEIGRGGMGVVYQARQLKLDRLVALKMILAGSHAGAADLARFQTEAHAIARLQHPNIVQVYEVGDHEGKPFLSLEFCGGGSLAQKLNGTPLPPREAAALVETLARAMQAAHEQHVVHRDLKPANVLLAADGAPKVTDFGLAKKLDEAGQTQSGAVLGTPSYMAPEQAGGKSLEIGPAADVYALGAILYECLTGRPPFKAATALDTMMQVVSDEPVPPTQLQSKTPRDLETICLKCLRKEARKRYGSARELADDLRRFLAGEPIRGRPVGRVERVAKWVKRNPLVTALVALVVLSVAGGATGIIVKYMDAREALIDRDAALQQARDNAEAMRHQLANSNVLLAQAAWNDDHVVEARLRLAAVPQDLRKWEWYYLNRQYQGGIFTMQGRSVAFNPDGTRLATASGITARLWDARTGQQLLACKGHAGMVTGVAFSPDGTRVATASVDGTARLWDARTGQPLLVCKGHTDKVLSLAFSPNGTLLATASEDRTARLWDARTGQPFLEFKGHSGEVMSVAFSPDGMRLATASADGTARLWDALTGKPLVECERQTGAVWGVAFSPDGTRLATACTDRTARLWDARTGRFLLECRGHTNIVQSVAFSPDGRRLATASHDDTARLWDVRTGQQLLVCKGHTGGVASVAFSPDEKLLATASRDETARLWDARTVQPLVECKGHTGWVYGVAFSPDRKLLATASEDQTARQWSARTGEPVLECKGHASWALDVAFSPDGTRLATANRDRTARLWDARTGQPLAVCTGHSGAVLSVAFSPDGTRLATASFDKTARLWDARTGLPFLQCNGHTGAVLGVAFRPDGIRLATASIDGTARLWDARTGRFLLECKGHTGPVTSVAFSPDATRLATASWDQTARLWDAQTGELLREFKGHTQMVRRVAFSPDATRLATASWDQTARLWDARTGQQLLVCKGHTGGVASVAFSPDGMSLAMAGSDVPDAMFMARASVDLPPGMFRETPSSNQTARLLDARPVPLPPDEEREYRLWATRAEPDWHEEQFKKVQGSERFAAAFHLDRLLACRPAQRANLLRQRTQYLEETLKQNKDDAVARLLLTRTAWHSPLLGPKDADPLLPAAEDKHALAQRTRAGLLLRLKKADEAIPVLQSTLQDRGDDKPPVEELLLAWAYLDTNQPDMAKSMWAKATAWLDHPPEPARVNDIVGAPTDSRYNAFDWETWHELDVLRRELAPRFEVKKP
jgi:WD40 repeat protein